MLAGTARICFNLFGFTLQILPAQQLACPLHLKFPAACPLSHIPWSQRPFFTCSKNGTPCINTFHTENRQPLRCIAGTACICFNLFGFTLQILSARQLACPLHLKFPAACPLSHIPWSQRLFSPAPKTARHTWSVPKCFP